MVISGYKGVRTVTRDYTQGVNEATKAALRYTGLHTRLHRITYMHQSLYVTRVYSPGVARPM